MKKMFIRFKDERAFLDAEKEELGRWSDDLHRASLAQVQDFGRRNPFGYFEVAIELK